MTEPTLTEIAKRITWHLCCFEADHDINESGPYGRRYYMPRARRSGARIRIAYKSFQQPGSPLTRDEATAYLAWLETGNVGTHFNFQNDAKPRRSEAHAIRFLSRQGQAYRLAPPLTTS